MDYKKILQLKYQGDSSIGSFWVYGGTDKKTLRNVSLKWSPQILKILFLIQAHM